MDDDGQAAPKPNAQLNELTKMLQAAQAEEAQYPKGAADDGLFAGMTAGSLIVGIVLSTVGIGMLRYGRVTLQWLWAIVGVILMTVPFFITNTWILTGVGVGVVAFSLLLKRFVTF